MRSGHYYRQPCLLFFGNFSCFDYLYFESLFIDDLKVVEIVSLYQEAINSISKETYGKVSKELISMLHQIENNVEYHHSFMFDATVYKIDDVRKREENERSK